MITDWSFKTFYSFEGPVPTFLLHPGSTGEALNFISSKNRGLHSFDDWLPISIQSAVWLSLLSQVMLPVRRWLY